MGAVGQIQLMRCDVRSRAAVEAALEGATAAVNLVGVLHQTPGRNFQTMHVEAARAIAEAAAERGIRDFVQVSAIGADPDSKSKYARTKGDAEQAVLRAVPTATVIRPSIVFGPEDDFFNRFAALAGIAPALPLPGGGKTRFQPVFVGDVAEAVARTLGVDAARGQTYELGGPAIHTFRELMQIVMRETGRRRPLVPLPWSVAGLIGLAGDLQSAILPFIAPPLTSDQVLLLQSDNICAPKSKGLHDLGIQPAAVEAVVPTYLWRYRKGGQFAPGPAGRG
jgi:NADH dehydrogenase